MHWYFPLFMLILAIDCRNIYTFHKGKLKQRHYTHYKDGPCYYQQGLVYCLVVHPSIDFDPLTHEKEEPMGLCPSENTFICPEPLDTCATKIFQCQYDHECPIHYRCCRDSCFRHKVCKEVEDQATTTATEPKENEWSEEETSSEKIVEKETETPTTEQVTTTEQETTTTVRPTTATEQETTVTTRPTTTTTEQETTTTPTTKPTTTTTIEQEVTAVRIAVITTELTTEETPVPSTVKETATEEVVRAATIVAQPAITTVFSGSGDGKLDERLHDDDDGDGDDDVEGSGSRKEGNEKQTKSLELLVRRRIDDLGKSGAMSNNELLDLFFNEDDMKDDFEFLLA